ncbi:hypothetical protein DFH28DRAFT_897706 [Melampsora americana]|nr:hypothetical protein DFH28DRAFT_897706 [Melampsora americana]
MIKIFNIFRSKNEGTGLLDLEISVPNGEAHSSVDKDQIYQQDWFEYDEWLDIISQHVLSFFSKTFPPVVHFFPMPKAKIVTSYFLTPINPYRSVPNPAKQGETGLVCKSKSCKSRPTHSTTYFESKHKHLVGVQCPIDPSSFTRTYNREQFTSEIRAINRRPIVTPGAINRTMDLLRMLNAPQATQPMGMFDVLPTPPPSQPMRMPKILPTQPQTQSSIERNEESGSPAHAGECKGVNGSIAPGHQSQNNTLCMVDACKACCLRLNKGPGATLCRKHNAMGRRHLKEIYENGRVSVVPSRASNVINIVSSSSVAPSDDDPLGHTSGQGACSHGVRPFKGRVNLKFLDGYRTHSLQREADDRQRTANVANASKAIALVVWPGSKDDPSGSWGGMVHASGWPQFALDQSVNIKGLVSQELGADWKGSLQVWNDENQLWLHTAMDILVTYPEETCKLLVLFPGIKTSSCNNIEHHIASVSTGRHKDVMNLTAFIQSTDSVSPRKGKNHRIINLRTPSDSDSEEGQSPIALDTFEDADVEMAMDDDHPQTPTMGPRTKRVRSPSIHSSQTYDHEEQEGILRPKNLGWSQTATMLELKRLYDLTEVKPKKSIKAAFKVVFGERFPYKVSTMSHYCRWCGEINPKILANFVARHGHLKVADVREHHFPKEWRITDTRFKDKDTHPNKRVKL